MKKGADLYVPSVSPATSPAGSRWKVIPAVALALLIFGWALVDFIFEEGSFAAGVSERVSASEEAAGALLRLFGALVLALFVANGVGRRLHWVASGFVVLGLGHLTFGYVEPLIKGEPASLYEGLYEALFVDTVAGVLLAVGLVSKTPPAFSPRVFLVLAGLIVASVFGFEALEDSALAPPMASVGDLGTVVELELSPFAG